MTNISHIAVHDRIVLPVLGTPSVCRVLAVFEDGLKLQEELTNRIFWTHKVELEKLDNRIAHMTNYSDMVKANGGKVSYKNSKMPSQPTTKAKKSTKEKTSKASDKRIQKVFEGLMEQLSPEEILDVLMKAQEEQGD